MGQVGLQRVASQLEKRCSCGRAANAAVNIDAFPQGQASIPPFWLLALRRH